MTAPAHAAKPLSAQDPEFWEYLSRKRGVDKGFVKRYEILVNKIGRGEVLVEEIQSNLGKELVERIQARMLKHLDIITDATKTAEDHDNSRREYAAYENVLGDVDEIVKTLEGSVTKKAEMDVQLQKEE